MQKSSSQSHLLRRLLRKHRLQDGVYVRVAKRLGLDPSYVSKVASGRTVSVEIYRALLKGYSESSACEQETPAHRTAEAASPRGLVGLPDGV
jgi:transcriptional regulator with XRE-family HTH domain